MSVTALPSSLNMRNSEEALRELVQHVCDIKRLLLLLPITSYAISNESGLISLFLGVLVLYFTLR